MDTPHTDTPHDPEPHMIAGVARAEIPPTRWWQYVRDVTGDVPQLQIAQRAGIDKTHPTRWKQGFPPGAEFVVKFAEAYGRNVLEALVAAEIITEEHAQLKVIRVTDFSDENAAELLAQVDTDVLIDELRRRLRKSER